MSASTESGAPPRVKSNIYYSTKIGTFLWTAICTAATAASAAAKKITENITKDITHIAAKIKTAKAAKTASASAALFKCRMTKLIILLTFLRIT